VHRYDEAVDVDVGDDGLIHIQHSRSGEGTSGGGAVVIDPANAAWLAGKLEAIANDPAHPQVFHVSGADAIGLIPVHGQSRSVTVQNKRTSSAPYAGETRILLSVSRAQVLARMLREPEPTNPLVKRVRRWSERLCDVTSTAKHELAAAIEGAADRLPSGINQIILDDRVVSLGGVTVRFVPGRVRRADIIEVFGVGTETVRLAPHHPIRHMYEIQPAASLHGCSVFVEYGRDASDDVVRGVKLRVDPMRSVPTIH
jgi:hypothetical protein